jgi:hypothetical protein
MDDDKVYNDIPSDWWLSPDSKARLLLTCMVHQKNKEVAPLRTGHKRKKTKVPRGKQKIPERLKKESKSSKNEPQDTSIILACSTNSICKKMLQGWQLLRKTSRQLKKSSIC